MSDADLSDTTALVTGSTSGIGRAGALSLGRLGATVFVHGRDVVAGTEVVAEIEDAGGTAEFVRADFVDPDDVSDLASTVRDSVDSLDVLCNNAGGFVRDRGETDLGVDRAFHVNHLATYQLTAELLPILDAGSRVVTTASVAHRGTTLEFDTLMDLTGFSPVAAYCRSILANILFANELANRLEAAGREVTSIAFHPGVIPGSEFGRGLPGFSPELWQLVGEAPLPESVEDGAATLVYLAGSPEVEGVSGKYFARCRQVRPDPVALDRDAQRELWERSAELVDMDEPLAST